MYLDVGEPRDIKRKANHEVSKLVRKITVILTNKIGFKPNLVSRFRVN